MQCDQHDNIDQQRMWQWQMAATLDEIDRADEALTRFLEANATGVDLFSVRIVLREALLNAVIHGSAKDPQKTVDASLCVNPHQMTLTITDQGSGFCRSHELPSLEIAGDGGRGIPLMQIYASKLVYNDAGNQVTAEWMLDATCE
jgi:anti-sigma regulatory factor (Ser/Thr protein kinase)